MAELARIEGSLTREEKYLEIIKFAKSLVSGESDPVANAANICALLMENFDLLWVGFYFVRNDQLVLGPFQGPVACTRINYGKGVCGKAWELKETMLVPNVDLFEGHIACSSDSKSEIVVPMIHENKVMGVLDIDSQYLEHFDELDKQYLEELLQQIVPAIT